MKALHKIDRASVSFDDPNLVANAGLTLTGTLMTRLGLVETIDAKVKLAGRIGGANSGIKAATVVSALLAGADCIDDVDILRAGASGQVCAHELRAPSTIGTWLRAFRWGHVRQLDAAARQLLQRAWAAGAGPRPDEPVTIDIDSTMCKTYGLFKQGGRKYTRKHHRGYHPLLGVVAGYDQVVAARLREGVANDARGARSFVVETIRRVRAAGAGGKLTLRADSGFFSQAVVDACRQADVRFSITVKMNPYLQQAIDAIPDDAWTPIPDWQPRDGQAEIAEVCVPAFKDDPIPIRLIVRRVTPQAVKAGEQLALLPDWRYHALVTDIPGPLLQVEAFHRDHADVESTIKDLKHHAGLAHLPSGRFAANAAWLGLVAIAYNIGRWTLLAGKGIDCFCSTKTLRQRLIAWPARLARSGRRVILHAPEGWPWAGAVTAMLARLRALPAPV